MKISVTEICPFKWGDRVDHRTFGLGTICGEPTATVGPSERNPFSIENKGWNIPVKWDDPTRTANQVLSNHLRFVDRPNAKGGAYWNNEFKKHSAKVIILRETTDHILAKAFRPIEGNGLKCLLESLENERNQLEILIAFLEADESGEHA